MDPHEISKHLSLQSALLNNISNEILKSLKPIYSDPKCSIFSFQHQEISIYSNGDIFIRNHESEISTETEHKKVRCTYKNKYQDPLIKKSPFLNNNPSNITTPYKESTISSPQNESCKWKYGTKQDFEATHSLETLMSLFRDS